MTEQQQKVVDELVADGWTLVPGKDVALYKIIGKTLYLHVSVKPQGHIQTQAIDSLRPTFKIVSAVANFDMCHFEELERLGGEL